MTSQLLILLIFLGFTAFSWVSNKLREQAERKRQRDLQLQREEELLRSTNVMRRAEAEKAMETVSKTPQQLRMEELAERRRAQLQELRNRQAARAGQTTPATARPGPAASTGPRGQRPAQTHTQTHTQAHTQAQAQNQAQTRAQAPAPAAPAPAQAGSGERSRGRGVAGERSASAGGRTRRQERAEAVAAARARSVAPAESHGEPDELAPAGRPAKPITPVVIPVGDVAQSVRGLLGVGAPARARQQRALLAAAEVLGRPVALRSEAELPWNR